MTTEKGEEDGGADGNKAVLTGPHKKAIKCHSPEKGKAKMDDTRPNAEGEM